MNEAQTRFNKIDPKLRDAGWGIVPEGSWGRFYFYVANQIIGSSFSIV